MTLDLPVFRTFAAGVLAAGLLGLCASGAAARHVHRCDPSRPHMTDRCPPPPQARAQGKASPAIEAGGTAPAIGTTIPLLRPGTFRLDIAGFVENGLTGSRPGSSTLQESLMLGYGVSDRFTIFGGLVQSNLDRSGDLVANFVDPKVGFVYRLVPNPQALKGFVLDFVGDAAVNQPLRSPPSGVQPYGDLGPIVRGRLLATRDMGHGVTLQLSGGLLGTSIRMPTFAEIPGSTSVDVEALLGIAGQYRLAMFSPRFYLNSELDLMRPLTRNQGQNVFAGPFRTTESYSATLGATYVIQPGAVLARVTDTVAYNIAGEPSPVFQHGGSRNILSNTVGVTVSLFNLTPGAWLTH